MPNTPTPPPQELPDIYTPAQQLLALLTVANRALLSRPDDPLPRALALLTDFDVAAVDRVQAVTDTAGMYALWSEAPETFADYLLLGRLVYASPLGLSVATVFAPDGSAPPATLAERRAEVLAYVAHHAAWHGRLMEDYLLTRYEEEDQAEVAAERAALHTGAAAAFAEWQHSLGALVLPAPAPVLPLPGAGWSIEPQQIQLYMFSLAISVLVMLPRLSQHAFVQAVLRLPDYHPQRLEELREYLDAARPDQRLYLSRAQGLLLYTVAHLTLLLFVSDVLDGEGLDDMLRRRLAQSPAAADFQPDAISQLREAAAIMLTGYIEVVRENEGDTTDFQALEARLAPVLALAVA